MLTSALSIKIVMFSVVCSANKQVKVNIYISILNVNPITKKTHMVTIYRSKKCYEKEK